MINTPQAPYFDDFNIEKNFLKILFKPKLSVQTRELEQIQSMFQNQVETLASQIFQNGSVVSGGKFTFEEVVNYVKVYTEYDEELFNYNLYKDRYVYGLDSGILARVFNGWSPSAHEVGSLYIDYLSSGKITVEDPETHEQTEVQVQTFQPGEVLQIVSNVFLTVPAGLEINIGDTLRGLNSGAEAFIVNIDNNQYDVVFTTPNTFTSNESVIDNDTSSVAVVSATESIIHKAQVKATTDDAEAVGTGSAVYVDEGIYYIDGYFVHTGNQSKIVSPYTTITNVRVGFEKEVEIITSNEDPSLLDNANGYPNENAPGADRLKINLVLNYYNLYETPSENFVEVMTIENSVITGNASINQKYADIIDTMARRTYDESGNYTVKPFLIDIREFLDDGENNGIYKPEYFGYNTQGEALNASMKVFGLPAPGLAHVYGIKYYPYSSHADFLAACENRLAIGVEAGKAYVMGYEIDHTAKQWYPLLKARDTKTLINSPSTIFYGNYIKVKEVSGLPNIYQHQSIQLSSASSYTSGSSIIGSAKVYAIEVDSGTPGVEGTIYRLYLDNIVMSGANQFSSVNSLGYGTDFAAKTVKTNNTVEFYNVSSAALIFPMEKNKVAGIADSSYNYKKVYTETVSGTGSFTLNVDSNSRFVELPKTLIAITSGSSKGTIINMGDVTATVDGTGNLVVSNMPSAAQGETVMIIAILRKQVNNIKSKTLNENVSYNVTSPTSTIKLNHADGYRLRGVYDSGDPSVNATTSSTNVTDNYDFDDGQRDTYYDLASIKLKAGALAPTGRLLVVYDYFSHGTGDYFTVDSYTNQIPYEDIPTYTNSNGTYDLKDCLDLRGVIDTNGSTFTSSNLPHIMENDSTFECNLSYYLPRMDLLELDYKGNFNVKYGTSSEDPQYPVGSINSMTLYYLSMPAYTESPDDVVRVYCENKRYTMRDIGNLDSRITAIEDYILLNGYENDTNNITIYDASGYQCIKTGFIVDVFNDLTYCDLDSASFNCSIDDENGILRPPYKLNNIELVQSTKRQSTVVIYNGLYMIPYTSKSYITNTVNTSYIALNSNKMVEWEGNVVLNKTLATVYNANTAELINFGSNVGVSTSSVGQLKITRTLFGHHKYSWIGTNNNF